MVTEMELTKEQSTGRDASGPAIGINYGGRVFCVPGAVLERLKAASKRDIIILLELLADPGAGMDELAVRADCADNPSAVDNALAFWRGAGVVTDSQETAAAPSVPKRKIKEAVASLPNYTSDDVSAIIGRDPAVGSMLDECQRILGRVFGEAENMRLVSALDYFGLTPEYMLLVCAHCADRGKKSVAAVTKKLGELFDRGISTVELLDDYLLLEENSEKLETQIRKLFGMNMTRELTDRERSMIEDWTGKYGYDIDVIRRAYNITVDTIGEPALGYANAVMRGWYESDLHTPEQIDAAIAARREGKKKKEDKSFDSDDFFRAAIERTYGSSGSAPQVDNAGDGGRNVGNRRSSGWKR